jgi:predicted membrane protein DUF2231
MGLPLHPLVLHAAVVFVPLLVVAGVAYAVVPALRSRITWAAVLLALVTPFVVLVTKLSGDAFRARLATKGIGDEILAKVDGHRHFGTLTLYATIALAVAVLALVVLRNGNRGAQVVVGLVTVVLAGVAAYYVYRTGDSGARIAWNGM